jgi:hypothetical protein
MSSKIRMKKNNSDLFDWMLAIDFDLAECKCLRKNANLMADILSL